MQNKIRLAMAFVFAGLALAAAGCGGSSSDDASSSSDSFRVGLEAPLSGEQATLGKGMLKGAELAATQLNAENGILGKQVEIVPIDDAADPATGVKAAKSAIAAGLDGIVGPYNSGVGIETLPLYIRGRPGADQADLRHLDQQPRLHPAADDLPDRPGRLAGADRLAGRQDRRHRLRPDPELHRLGVEGAEGIARKVGVTVTAFEKVQPGEKSYTDVVDKLAATNPDVIYAAVYFPEGGLIAKEMREAKVESQCIADYASYDTGFVETAGVAAARACPVVGVPAPEDFSGAAAKVAEYRDEFDEAPGTWSPYTYDSLNFLADGVEKVGGTAAKKLTNALDGVKGWQGWTGSVTIDPRNGNRQPATVVIVDTDAKGQLHVDEDWAKAVDAPY